MVINIAKIAHLCETMEISSQKVADICPNFHRAFLPWRRLAPKKVADICPLRFPGNVHRFSVILLL